MKAMVELFGEKNVEDCLAIEVREMLAESLGLATIDELTHVQVIAITDAS